MELVKGVPVTEFCDRHRLTTRRRLELFLAVCAAVQHAHTKGVIHRDLLLTGTTPFEAGALREAGYDEMRRMIREDEPPRPSTRLSTLQRAARSTVAECRGVEPPKLCQQLRGELD